MSLLADQVRERIEVQASSVSELATAFHDDLAARDGADSTPELGVVESNLERLLEEDSAEAEAFFLRTRSRVEALGAALQLDPSAVLGLRRRRTLVLDPLLAPEIVAFLEQQKAVAPYECVQVAVEGVDPARASFERTRYGTTKVTGLTPPEMQAVRDALRKAARAQPGCLVVLTIDDRSFYSAADIETTPVERHPRGFVLTACPDLVPLPEPLPPRLHDGDGAPMVPHERFEAAVRVEIETFENPPWGRGGSYRGTLFSGEEHLLRVRDRLRETDAERLHASFRVEDILPWLAADQGVAGLRPIARLTFADAIADELPATYWWAREGRVVADGPGAEVVARMLRPHHEIERSDSIERFRTKLHGCNPFRMGAGAEIVNRFEQETGHTLEVDRELWARQVDRETLLRRAEARRGAAEGAEAAAPVRWRVRPSDEAAAAEAKAQVRELLSRDFVLEPAQIALPFVLRAVLDAPVAVLPLEGHDRVHLVASLGAGRLLRVRVMFFGEEEPEPITPAAGACEYDGGDVHVWLVSLRLRTTSLRVSAPRRRA